MNIEDRIEQIKEEIRKTPYHKGTEHHIGRLKARLAQLKKTLKKQKVKSKGVGFAIKKSGDATVVLVGLPSVGKSTLLNKLTDANSKVGNYSFTTTQAVPGMLLYKGAQIQIIDLPGLIGGAAKGLGRGREVLSVARNGDLILLMTDVKSLKFLPKIKKELKESGIKTELPILILINKIDLWDKNQQKKLENKNCFLISAKTEKGITELKEAIFQKLNLIRIFLKPDLGEVDYENPLILKSGQTVLEAAQSISAELGEIIKSARVWGKSAKFPGQYVSLSHQLKDKDILALSKR